MHIYNTYQAYTSYVCLVYKISRPTINAVCRLVSGSKKVCRVWKRLGTWAVIVIQLLSKWTPRFRWCQLVGLQYHQARRYCSQVDGDTNRNSDLDAIHSKWSSNAVHSLCSSSGVGHVGLHLLFSVSAVYSTKRMGPIFPLIFRSLCAHKFLLCNILLGLEKCKKICALQSWVSLYCFHSNSTYSEQLLQLVFN